MDKDNTIKKINFQQKLKSFDIYINKIVDKLILINYNIIR